MVLEYLGRETAGTKLGAPEPGERRHSASSSAPLGGGWSSRGEKGFYAWLSKQLIPELHPQSVCHTGHRAERHGNTRQHWVEQSCCGNWNQEEVVAKGPPQVLKDIPVSPAA